MGRPAGRSGVRPELLLRESLLRPSQADHLLSALMECLRSKERTGFCDGKNRTTKQPHRSNSALHLNASSSQRASVSPFCPSALSHEHSSSTPEAVVNPPSNCPAAADQCS